MGQIHNQRESQAGTQEKPVLGIQVKHDVIHGLYAGGLGQNLGDDADKDKVDEKGRPYVVPVHVYYTSRSF
jgi:hypothetical protein